MVIARSLTLAAHNVAAPVEGMHRAIARRVIGVAGRRSTGLQDVYDVALNVAYGSVRIGSAVLAVVIEHAVSIEPETADRIKAITNGLWGDAIAADGDTLEIAMEIRTLDGATVAPEPNDVVHMQKAKGHVVVLVHGLFESDNRWLSNNDSGLVSAISRQGNMTVLTVRYNSGLRIEENGDRLAELLEVVSDRWPTPIESLSLVGSSMGGLVAMKAHDAGVAGGHGWVGRLSHLVTVAAPHTGTPIAKAVDLAARALAVTRETLPLSEFLESRSLGIKDMQSGLEKGAIKRSSESSKQRLDAPRPTRAEHHFLAVTATHDPGHLMAKVVGDFVVRISSATARRSSINCDRVTVGGSNHLSVMSMPDVIDQVMRWISPSNPT